MIINYRRSLCVIFSFSACSTIVFLLLLNLSKVPQVEVFVLLVDEQSNLTEEAQYKSAQKSMPIFPVEFWRANALRPLRFNKSCAKFPSPYDVEYQNLYWQNLRSSYGHYQLFGAYLDNRVANPLGPTVRIFAMVDQVEPITTMYCQLWFFEMTQPVMVRASNYSLTWRKAFGNYRKGVYQPYLIPCSIPSEYQHLSVAAVSLVENECDHAKNALTVFYNKPRGEKQNFAVCVKNLDFLLEDVSSVLTEWIEMMTLLGADKIFLYYLNVHPNISKVFKYYEDLGRVEAVPLSLPAGQPNAPYWQHLYLEKRYMNRVQDEVISLNDCLYKHMHEYKYLVVVDIDEVIVPLNGSTWNDLMDHLERTLDKEYDSYNARNVYYFTDLLFTHKWFDDVPEYMHILNHIHRAPTILKAGINIKSFHNTKTVLSLHNHFPVACLRGGCKNFPINPDDALMHHYKRKPIKRYTNFRETSIIDTTIWKYKKVLVKKVTKALKDMGFLVPLKKPLRV